MLKRITGVLTFLLVAGSSLAYAQDSSPPVPSEIDFKVVTDARLGIVKAALQLTPEQEKLWPPVEEAIRGRAEARYQRMVAMAGKLGQQREVDPVELLRGRADALAQRSADLKNLASAWEPLYKTLTPEQRKRMAVLTIFALRDFRDHAEHRLLQAEEDED